jgi:hypothetical protein
MAAEWGAQARVPVTTASVTRWGRVGRGARGEVADFGGGFCSAGLVTAGSHDGQGVRRATPGNCVVGRSGILAALFVRRVGQL